MMTRPLTARVVALVVVAAVSLVAAGPAFARMASSGSCAAMAGDDACGRGSLVASCCCADAHPATPADRPAPAGSAPSFEFAPSDAGWLPVAVLVPACAAVAPTHGYQSVPLHTLFSTLLI